MVERFPSHFCGLDIDFQAFLRLFLTDILFKRLRTQTEVELAVLVMCRRVDDSVVIHIIVRIAGFKFVDHILPCPFRCHPLSFAILFCLSQSVKAAFPFCGAPP